MLTYQLQLLNFFYSQTIIILRYYILFKVKHFYLNEIELFYNNAFGHVIYYLLDIINLVQFALLIRTIKLYLFKHSIVLIG